MTHASSRWLFQADTVSGAGFTSLEEPGGNVSKSIMGGLECCSQKAMHRCRTEGKYYYGFNPYGQCFNRKIDSFGLGFYPAFQARDIERTTSPCR
ncbi:MAG: hypothetical protein KGS09_02540 [Nitrospirae bacterium]|nr:hypothetical protein [Nitrospirota bacterium]MBU6479409.1 hypothetical protein [Nitrospirota bacterium]MDE3049444.1 hypothetical protein [Nitrospirota bacterium]MDE3219329.1 hypothetical protein [Nitrospirota bacterium]